MAGYVKLIMWFDHPAALACDGKCGKAWGINHRPNVQLSKDNEDDCAFLADGELPDAPENPGTYEGGHGKPLPHEPKLNKWCARECERSTIYGHLDAGKTHETLPDFSERVYNIPR